MLEGYLNKFRKSHHLWTGEIDSRGEKALGSLLTFDLRSCRYLPLKTLTKMGKDLRQSVLQNLCCMNMHLDKHFAYSCFPFCQFVAFAV